MSALSIPGARTTLRPASGTAAIQLGRVRVDRWVFLVVIAIAIVIVAGLAVAWWAACQGQGAYPAVDMPSFSTGGTWKVYCAK